MARANYQGFEPKLLFDKMFALNLTNSKQFIKFGREMVIDPKGSNGTIRFRYFPLFAEATTPLSEGTPPTPTTMTSNYVEVSPKQYGSYVEFTDLDLEDDPVDLKKEASEKLSEQAGHTLNIITRDILETSTNVYYAGGVADAASITTAVSKNDIDNIVNILERNNVKRGLKFVSSSSNFNTTPIDDAYVGIVHPDVAKDIRNLDNFIPVASYGERNRMEQEIGEVGGIRFVIDTDCKIDTGAGGSTTTLRNTGGNADVYSCYILGDDAFGRVSFKNKNIKLIDKPLGSAGTGDALDQKASMGWKIRYGAVIMYMEKVLIYKVGATK